MRYFLPAILLFLAACHPGAEPSGEVTQRMPGMVFEDIRIRFEYPDTTEVETFQEYVSPLDNGKFRITDVFPDGATAAYYMTVEIDTEKKRATRYMTRREDGQDSPPPPRKQRIGYPVEEKAFPVGGRLHLVYRFLEMDEFAHSCNTNVVSEEFGFLYGRSGVGGNAISQQSEDPVVQQLIARIAADSLFTHCEHRH